MMEMMIGIEVVVVRVLATVGFISGLLLLWENRIFHRFRKWNKASVSIWNLMVLHSFGIAICGLMGAIFWLAGKI